MASIQEIGNVVIDLLEQKHSIRIIGKYMENFPSSSIFFDCNNQKWQLEVNIDGVYQPNAVLSIIRKQKLVLYSVPLEYMGAMDSRWRDVFIAGIKPLIILAEEWEK